VYAEKKGAAVVASEQISQGGGKARRSRTAGTKDDVNAIQSTAAARSRGLASATSESRTRTYFIIDKGRHVLPNFANSNGVNGERQLAVRESPESTCLSLQSW